MTTQSLLTLVMVLAAATLAPMLCRLLRRVLSVPVVVMDLLLGIIIGPGLLGLATSNTILAGLAAIGVWFLFFSAGYETDFISVKDRLGIASGAWLICLLLAVGAGFIIGGFLPDAGTSQFVSAVFIGGALVSTGLGTMLPMMRDANQITTRVGKAVISSGVIGQFAPQIAIGILVGHANPATAYHYHNPLIALLLHLLFFVAIGGLIWGITRFGIPRFMLRIQSATLDTGAQWAVIFQVFLCLSFVLIGELLGVDRAIGAFAAGLLSRAIMQHIPHDERVIIDRKTKAVEYGVFLPIFFINAGLTFDLPGLLAQPAAFALIPVFFLLKLIIRGLPGSATLERPASWRERVSVTMLVGTGLAAVILISNIGLEAGAISSTTAAALIGAAMLSALIFPTIALNLANSDPANAAPVTGLEFMPDSPLDHTL